MSPSGVLSGTMLIYCLGVLVLTGVLALVLIAGIRKQRREIETLKATPVLKPFPHPARQPFLLPSGLDQKTLDEKIREAYAVWLRTYVMVDSEPGRAFIYSGVQPTREKGRRLELAATSLGQAFGMLIQLLIAGEDPMAQQRFERLYLYLLAHPSAEAPDLAAWQSFPDEHRSSPADADPYAEMLISMALIAAQAQWPQRERVFYANAARTRAGVLLPLIQAAGASESKRDTVKAVWGFDSLAAWTRNKAWADLSRQLPAAAPEGTLTWLQLWQDGLDALYAPVTLRAPAGEAQAKAMALLEEAIPTEADKLRSYTYADSALTRFAAAVPLLLSMNQQEITDRTWKKLAETEPWRKDGFGASLRLLGMIILAGRFWLPDLDWSALPLEEKPEIQA